MSASSFKKVGFTNSDSVFTLTTSEPFWTGLVPFLKADISRLTGTCQLPDVQPLKTGTKPVWNGSEVASVNAL